LLSLIVLGGSELGEGNLDGELSAFHVLVVERSKSLLLISFVVELDESKALRSAGSLLNDVGALVSETGILENLGETIILDGERQVGNKESSG